MINLIQDLKKNSNIGIDKMFKIIPLSRKKIRKIYYGKENLTNKIFKKVNVHYINKILL